MTSTEFQTIYTAFVQDYNNKLITPDWFTSNRKTLYSKNITLEDWNQVQLYLKNLSSENEATAAFLKVVKEYAITNNVINASLLNTYTQTEANLADAVNKKHNHDNKTILDQITAPFTSEEKTKLANVNPSEISEATTNLQTLKDEIGNVHFNNGIISYTDSDNTKHNYINVNDGDLEVGNGVDSLQLWGVGDRPTYNDDYQIAFVDDLENYETKSNATSKYNALANMASGKNGSLVFNTMTDLIDLLLTNNEDDGDGLGVAIIYKNGTSTKITTSSALSDLGNIVEIDVPVSANVMGGYKNGDNFFIKDIDVPDFWIFNDTATNTYKLYKLETQKVDLNNYVEKVTGKDLSTNDFTDEYKSKIDKEKSIALSSAFLTRITASDSTNTKYEIKDKSLAKINYLCGYSKKVGEEIKHAPTTEIKSIGKNILEIPDVPETTIFGVKYSAKDGVITLNGTCTVGGWIHLTNYNSEVFNGIYSSRMFNSNISTTNNTRISLVGQKETILATMNIYNSSKTITINDTVQWLGLNLYLGETYTNFVIKPMLVNEDVSPTTFEPYTEQTLQIPSQVQALEGYGWGLSTTDKSLTNYVDFQRKVFVKNVETYTFNINNVWNYIGTITAGIARFGFHSLENVIKYPPSTSTNTKLICEGIETTSAYNTYSCKSGISIDTSGTVLVYQTDIQTATAMASFMDGKTMYYQLATPVEIDISEYLTDDTYLADNIGTETLLGTEIEALADITYNADLDAQIVENADNIANLYSIVGTLNDTLEDSLNGN